MDSSHLLHGSLAPHESAQKRHLDLFIRFCVHRSRLSMLFNGPNNRQNYPFPGQSGPLSNTWFLGSTGVSPSTNGISISSVVFQGSERDQQTHRHNDRQTKQICIKNHYLVLFSILVLSVSDSVYLCLCRCQLIYHFSRLLTYLLLWVLASKGFLTSCEFPFVHIFFTPTPNSYYMLRIYLILCYIVLSSLLFMNNKIFACLLRL